MSRPLVRASTPDPRRGRAAYIESRSDGYVTLVPRAAVGAVGNRNVIYVLVEGGEGHFAARTVKLGESFAVLDGVKPGQLVVIAGSFFLRAEASRTPLWWMSCLGAVRREVPGLC